MNDTDKPAFREAFSQLAVALREKDPDAVTMRVYFDGLKQLEIEFVIAAAKQLQRTSAWFPKVGEWRAVAVQCEQAARERQRAFLRKLSAPLCAVCSDTGWMQTDGGAQPCTCRHTRRLELLGRQPWPQLPDATSE